MTPSDFSLFLQTVPTGPSIVTSVDIWLPQAVVALVLRLDELPSWLCLLSLRLQCGVVNAFECVVGHDHPACLKHSGLNIAAYDRRLFYDQVLECAVRLGCLSCGGDTSWQRIWQLGASSLKLYMSLWVLFPDGVWIAWGIDGWKEPGTIWTVFRIH